MKISRNTVATVSFIVTEQDGQVVGRTQKDKPVVTLVGHGYLVPGLEKAIDGHEKGDEFAVTLHPKDSYGEYDERLCQTVSRDMFGDFPIEEGAVFEAENYAGKLVPVVIKKIRDREVDLDGNHPLAGKTLNFLVTIEDVREATPEEIAHGHAHPEGHCPSEHEDAHHCCCGHHHEHEEGHKCCGHHHHDHEDGHECCGHHHHEHEDGHECQCGHHHHDHDKDHECCHHHEDKEHHCCCHDKK